MTTLLYQPLRLTLPTRVTSSRFTHYRTMATVKSDLPHLLRTSHERRLPTSWRATVSHISQINSTIRLLRLSILPDQAPLRHLPGQYVDLSIPNVKTVGGFTITSPPQSALSFLKERKGDAGAKAGPTHGLTTPYIELAVQRSEGNPPAKWLWQPVREVEGKEVSFKVGGEFVFPPMTLGKEECEALKRVVFVAGGVGVNPVMSMLSAMDAVGEGRLGGMVKDVRVLYTFRRERERAVLFEERIEEMARRWEGSEGVRFEASLFDTGVVGEGSTQQGVVARRRGRINESDLLEAIGPEEGRDKCVVYVCGVPGMTDDFVQVLRQQKGMDESRVLCEKWW